MGRLGRAEGTTTGNRGTKTPTVYKDSHRESTPTWFRVAPNTRHASRSNHGANGPSRNIGIYRAHLPYFPLIAPDV